MRVRCSPKPLPRRIADMFPDVKLDAYDVVWKRGPRVKAVFVHNYRDFRKVWNGLSIHRDRILTQRMGNGCLAFCHPCWGVWGRKGEKGVMVVDKRYAAVVVFLAPKLSHEVIAHEAFHAGLAMLRRRKHNPHATTDAMADEEVAAWTAGKVAHHCVHIARHEGWLS